jgi:SecD/SecF fusion protein
MFRQNLWKLLLSIAIVIWAVAELIPFKDRQFDEYIRSEAKASPTEFAAVMKQAVARVDAKQAPTVFVALKEIGHEQKLDLSKFFPQIRLEASLKNVERRNNILLDELLRRSKGRLQLGLDLKGGVAFTLEVAERGAAAGTSPRDSEQKLSKAIEIISTRINSLGVAEPIVRPVGNNRIEVQLPGVTTKDNPEIVSSLKKPARLDFRLVNMTQTPETTPLSEAPPGYEPMTLEQEGRNGEIRTSELYVKRIPEMTGDALSDAYATMDEFGRFKILLRFTKEGAKRFADVTRTIAEDGKRAGRLGQLAIILDGKLYSAPSVHEEIPSGSAEITGSFSQREAIELANVLNNPLDLPLEIKEQYEVGPSLAQDAIDSAVRASVIGTVLVAAFMITYYTVGGIIAVGTLAVNVAIILGVLASIGATMTLPGLAGIVLTIGMAVDANILIFERMREELHLGKTLKTAVVAGYDKAFFTIVDAHVTQLCICAIMIWLGTGPVKGFGVTLAIGVFSTMFSVLITSHLVLEYLVNADIIKKMPMLHLLSTIKTDFVRYAKGAFICSWIIVLIGVSATIVKGRHAFGIDFLGGDVVSIEYNKQHQPALAQVRQIANENRIGEINPAYVTALAGGKDVLKIETAYGESAPLFSALQKAFPQAELTNVGESRIGATIGREVEWNALLSVALSMVVILLYVAFRFEFGLGIGAVVASVHDILMTIGIFVLFGYQFSAPMVAAILSIAGYSINDTIVVFDRIREELKVNPNVSLRDIINGAIRKVFARSIMTSLTTFLAALSLFLFGSGVMRDLSFTFLVGIITGTFSSIYIAAPVFYWWHKGDRKHVEAHHDIAPKYEWTGSSKASQ